MANESRKAAIFKDGPQLRLRLEDIGGGRVVRAFTSGNKRLRVGETLTADEIMAINPSNRQVLLGKFIAVWPKAPGDGLVASDSSGRKRAERAGRHVVALGFGRFRVIEGVDLTPTPVSENEAFKLAGIEPPPKEPTTKSKKRVTA